MIIINELSVILNFLCIILSEYLMSDHSFNAIYARGIQVKIVLKRGKTQSFNLCSAPEITPQKMQKNIGRSKI